MKREVRLILKALRGSSYERRDSLPWRKTRDPYKILVSEMMLQQTGVDRVVPFYATFLKRFPTLYALASAPLSSVLKEWQGLGYNRRAKYLHDAAKAIVAEYDAKIPHDAHLLERLPGIGHYTARAVAAFAFDAQEAFIETNIRTVVFHHMVDSASHAVADRELLPIVAEILKRSKMSPREFYAAMMDYGAHLKRSGVRLNSKSVHYTKQTKFEGSTRQLRAAILRELLAGPASVQTLAKRLGRKAADIKREADSLQKDKLILISHSKYSIV